MSEPYVTQIEVFAFGYAPRGWLPCNGQFLPLNQYQALFALLGTTYGGNGISNFQLPDLRSRVAVSSGQGAGLSNYNLGETTGQESVTITMANMPGAHTHALNATSATTGGSAAPASNVLLGSGSLVAGQSATDVPIYSSAAPTVAMGSLAPVGGQPHSNLMPTMALNYCICISGVFPSRN
jgi:microcystin-dependent protein